MEFSTDQTERYTWAAWLLFVLICSVLGNTAILVASLFKHDVFGFHVLMVALVQHMAVCDLLISVSTIFPRMVSLFTNNWIFGTPLCYLTAYLTAYSIPASSYLTCTMTTSKLWILKSPQRAKSFSKLQAHLLCLCIWALGFCIPILYLIVDKNDVDWSDKTFYCYYKHSGNKWDILKPCKHAVFGGIPVIVVIVTSVFLIKHLLEAREASKRSKGTVRWQGIATVVTVACVYTIAILPLTMYWIVESYLTAEQAKIFSRTATTFFYFNVASNVFIYFFTIKGFKRFLQAMTNCNISYLALSSTGKYCLDDNF